VTETPTQRTKRTQADHRAEDQSSATTDEQQELHDQQAGNGVEQDAETAVSEVEQLRAERDEYLEQLRRTLADFANFKRRTEQDRALVRQLANRDLLLQIIEVQDDFDRALNAIPEDQRENGWVSGTAMIERKLNAVLERAGVTQLDALGQPFDPSLHEAVASDPGSSAEQVVEVFRTGYKLGDQVLRAAMVRTGDKPVA
jgi:molecular chaperone GrpE